MKYFVFAVAMLQSSIGQTIPKAPEFEVASIKPCNGNGRGGSRPTPGRLNLGCQSAETLIQIAYGIFASGSNNVSTLNLRRIGVVGAPAWAASEMYEINAKAEGRADVGQMAGPMLKQLLEDRFHLKIHRETRQKPIYELTIAKSGAKLQPLKEGACVPIDLEHLPEAPAPGEPIPNFCGRQNVRFNGQLRTTEVHGTSLANFAEVILSEQLDRPVFDKTGLSGLFDIHLEFARDTSMLRSPGRAGAEDSGAGAANPPDSSGPSIFTAVQEQLGLKLSAAKGPVDVLVVDRIERPSAN
jgi:uncharacterized protein (TIGR03435 family)